DLDREVKRHCRYARKNGIHVSPTFIMDGLVQTDMSSGDPGADWVARLSDHCRQGWCKKRVRPVPPARRRRQARILVAPKDARPIKGCCYRTSCTCFADPLIGLAGRPPPP